MTLSTLHLHLNLETSSLAFQNSYSEGLHARLGKPQRKFCFAHQMCGDVNSERCLDMQRGKRTLKGVQDLFQDPELDRVSVEAEPEARLQSPSHCCGCFPTISPISQGPSLRFLTSSSPYQIPALHPRPETWWVLCYMNNTGGVGPGWTGGTRYGQQTDSVHREDETLPPGEAWPQEVLLTQQ